MIDAIFKTVTSYSKSMTMISIDQVIKVGENEVEIFYTEDFEALQLFFKELGYNVIVIETEETKDK